MYFCISSDRQFHMPPDDKPLFPVLCVGDVQGSLAATSFKGVSCFVKSIITAGHKTGIESPVVMSQMKKPFDRCSPK